MPSGFWTRFFVLYVNALIDKLAVALREVMVAAWEMAMRERFANEFVISCLLIVRKGCE